MYEDVHIQWPSSVSIPLPLTHLFLRLSLLLQLWERY